MKFKLVENLQPFELEKEKSRIRDVLDILKDIDYGFISKTTGEKITDREWIHNNDYTPYYDVNYNPEKTIRDKLGICQDQAIATKYLMNKYHPEDSVYLYALTKSPKGHCVACYCHDGKWYYLENSWDKERGLYGPFDSQEELEKYLGFVYYENHKNDTPKDSKVVIKDYIPKKEECYSQEDEMKFKLVEKVNTPEFEDDLFNYRKDLEKSPTEYPDKILNYVNRKQEINKYTKPLYPEEKFGIDRLIKKYEDEESLTEDQIQYNANPYDKNEGDCAIRSLSLAYDKNYNNVKSELNSLANKNGGAFNSINTISDYIKKNHYVRYYQHKSQDDSYHETVEQFAKKNHRGVWVVHCTDKNREDRSHSFHLVTVVDGNIYDTWDPAEYYVEEAWYIKPYNRTARTIEQ